MIGCYAWILLKIDIHKYNMYLNMYSLQKANPCPFIEVFIFEKTEQMLKTRQFTTMQGWCYDVLQFTQIFLLVF